VAIKNNPIDRHLFAGADAASVPNLHLIERHIGFTALVVKTLCCLRSQAKQRSNRAAGLAAGAQLQHLTQKNQSNNDRRRLKINIDLPSGSTKRRRKDLGNNGGEDAVKIGDYHSLCSRCPGIGTQRDGMVAATFLVAPDEKGGDRSGVHTFRDLITAGKR
jgi:hypothetical protein